MKTKLAFVSTLVAAALITLATLCAVVMFSGCSSTPYRPVVAKFKTAECTIAGIYYPATYCVYATIPGKSADQEVECIWVDKQNWDACPVSR